MKKLLLWILIAGSAWLTGCATSRQKDGGPPASGVRLDGGGPRKLDVKPGSLRMRAPAAAAVVPPSLSESGEGPGGGGRGADAAAKNDDGGAYRLKNGDPVVVNLRGIPNPLVVEDVIDEHGFITLPYINAVDAIGKTSSELERAIHDVYVPDFYRYVTVNVLIPTLRSYYVRGAVKAPGRFTFSAGITLLQAITTAGGYTDFANSKKVRLLRGGQTTSYSMVEIEKHPERDVKVDPGDVIVVPEKLW